MTAHFNSSDILGCRIVAIGGGTGLSTLLRGLKRCVRQGSGHADDPIDAHAQFIAALTAIVAVTDDGGSSGRLRRDFRMLPPGDLRNCMVALAEDEQLLSQLFRHRFRDGGELGGHTFGNLFITALSEMTGDFAQAVQLASEVLSIRGHVLPATSANATLVARMEDGSLIRGETRINASRQRIAEIMMEPSGAPAIPEALHAIASADLITIGPGSLYTSIITNLLVADIAEALATTRATRVYIANLMTEANESLGLSVADHIERIYEHAGKPIFDCALVNTGMVPATLRESYALKGTEPTKADIDRIEAMGIRCVTGNFVAHGAPLRHAADHVTAALLGLQRVSLSSVAGWPRRISGESPGLGIPLSLPDRDLSMQQISAD